MPKVRNNATARGAFDRRLLIAIIIILALTVLIITWFGIRESRSDSYKLLVMQGTAFTEALTRAAENAIESEHFFDYLVHKRFSEIVTDISQIELNKLNDTDLVQIAATHSLYAVFVYRMDSSMVAGGVARGSVLRPPDFVTKEVDQLIANPQTNYVLLLDQGSSPDEMIHYYIEMSNKLDRIVLLIADAGYYVEALKKTQIGYLAQKMAEEKGVEYILYQSTDGIIFASRKTGQLLSIESDPFLSAALESDTVMHREYVFEDTKVLELVKPFATEDYPFGLLRVGLTLDRFTAINRGYDLQMIALASILLILVVFLLLYINSRSKRHEIARQYLEIKSISERIFDEMRIGVAATDSSGAITLSNAAFERIIDSTGIVGRPWDSVINHPDLTFTSIIGGRQESADKEISLVLGQKTKELLISTSQLRDGEQVKGIVAVLYDLTLYRDLQRRSSRKERLSEMGNLAAGVAHEIRNPLNAISIAIQRLAAEFRPTENVAEFSSFTEQIKRETKRLNEIITRFLALTREDQQRRKDVDFKQVLDEFVGLAQFEANRLEIDLTVDSTGILLVKGEKDHLKQVLMNLFNNAKEALEAKPGKIHVSAERLADRVVIRFEDSGRGVPESAREKLFTPFFTTKQTGTGLGLSTVYKIVTDMDGEIAYEPSSLGGACFVISFPAV